MSRADAVARAEAYFDSGAFAQDLARRVAIATESQNPARGAELVRYIEAELRPALEALGFSCRILTEAKAKGPFLYAERLEGKRLSPGRAAGLGAPFSASALAANFVREAALHRARGTGANSLARTA